MALKVTIVTGLPLASVLTVSVSIFFSFLSSSDADRTPDLMSQSMGEQYSMLKEQAPAFLSPVCEFGDMSVKDMKVGDFFGRGKARPGEGIGNGPLAYRNSNCFFFHCSQ